MTDAVHYEVAIPDPVDHQVRVTLTFDARPGDRIQLPAWIPGSYMIRDFVRFLGPVTASDADGNPIALQPAGKGSWVLPNAVGTTRVSWTAWCHELTVRTPHIDDSHAFFNAANVLMRVERLADAPHHVRVVPPDGWQVWCGLDPVGDTFVTPDFEALSDVPFECGPHPCATFDVGGVPHRIVCWGAENVRLDLDRLVRDTRAIVESNARLFGGLPYPRYDFILHITATGRGGLEHRQSTVLATPWAWFDNEDGWAELLTLIAHEHFHVWNVKRIAPPNLLRIDLRRETDTAPLWIAEGLTTYIEDIVCHRAGLFSRDQTLQRIAGGIQALEKVPGRLVQSLEDAARDAWFRLYRPDDNTPNRTVSYYLKGAVVWFWLDLLLRARSNGEHSVETLVRALDALSRDGRVGYDAASFGDLILRSTGVDLSDALAIAVHGTDELPLDDALATHALRLTRHAEPGVELGFDPRIGETTVSVGTIRSDGPAADTALCPGDLLVAVGGRRVTPAGWTAMTARLRAGEAIDLHVFRRDVLRTITLVPAARPPGRFTLDVDDDAEAEARALLDRYLAPPRATPLTE